MIRSMTGFGTAVRETAAFRATVTARSLNNRYLEIHVSAPRELTVLEGEIRHLTQERIHRGRVEISLRAELLGVPVRLTVSRPLIEALLRTMRELGAEHGLETNTTVPELLGFPGVIDVWPDTVEIWPSLRGELLGLVRQALEELVEMRRSEGQRLTHDITGRLEAIERSTEELSELAEEAKAARREQLADRAAALRAELGLDEARLYQEIAKLVDRCDVNEEVVRLRSHLIQARAACADDESCGRRMDFLAQELIREANTAGSKSLSPEMVRTVVGLKSEIERLREQVQNVE